ncbi:MAG: UbiD family decarboxylase [Saprospiraceae bacterium]|nr:UbiD family decarboxylase [Saprospiraceae bacterium]
MSYKSLRACVNDLEATGQLIRVREEVDPYLEMAEIHRRIYDAQGPAILFEKVKDSPFQAVSNIYGTVKRTEFLFRKTIEDVKKVIALKADPTHLVRQPLSYLKTPITAISALPRRTRNAPVCRHQTKISQLPQIVSWPMDGGAFITLPQVFSQDPNSDKVLKSNLGMYRIQLSGNDYIQDEEIGLHYQLHRGIGVHHTQYKQSEKPFKVSIFVGGPPSHALSAIFPLPEGLSELTFAGMMGGRRFRYHRRGGHLISNDADFVITGTILKDVKKSEGPFGDHLGYYSLKHDFPVMKVDQVFHRKDPLWHFTVVGRPPQEDSGFGHIIHQLVGPLLAQEFPGVKALNAVDAAGVHPLLLAIGSERYMPFRERKPEEILTQANHILGSGQTSLAKYLIIAAQGDDPQLDVQDIASFLGHVLQRLDWKRDLHFHTKTTIDTLDYSGSGWNAGSKVVMACCGDPIRSLNEDLPSDLSLLDSVGPISTPLPGILAIQAPPFADYPKAASEMQELTDVLGGQDLDGWPLVVVVDDAHFLCAQLNNLLWVTFTRSNPSHDIYGVDSFVEHKHWGCRGSLVIDARIKSHHAPVLEQHKSVEEKVDRLFAKGGSLVSIDG